MGFAVMLPPALAVGGNVVGTDTCAAIAAVPHAPATAIDNAARRLRMGALLRLLVEIGG
jgi:hypothetical protein